MGNRVSRITFYLAGLLLSATLTGSTWAVGLKVHEDGMRIRVGHSLVDDSLPLEDKRVAQKREYDAIMAWFER